MVADTKARPDSGIATEGRQVLNHSGVGIGRVVDDGIVIDHSGIRIGRVADDGIVIDHSGVRIGRVASQS